MTPWSTRSNSRDSPGREWVVTTRTAQQAASTAQQSTRKTTRRASSAEPDQDLRTYVLDTSVLLSDPQAFFRFAEHSVVLPVVVITELEGKRHDPEIGYFARQALRHLDDLRIEHGRLDFPVEVGEGARFAWSSRTPTPRSSRQASGSATTTRGSCPSPCTSRRTGRTSRSSPRTSRCA
ncbi:PIN domain-containing protein [Microbacterium aurugineum]